MIYFVQVEEDGPIKIGFTSTPIAQKMAALKGTCPFPIRLLGVIQGDFRAESYIFWVLNRDRIHGEWFHPTDRVTTFVGTAVSPGFCCPRLNRVIHQPRHNWRQHFEESLNGPQS